MPYGRQLKRPLHSFILAALTTIACSTPRLPSAPATPATPEPGVTPALTIYTDNNARVVNIVSSAVLSTVIGPSPVPQGTGSGFVYDALGHIVTNDHVIQDGQQLEVNFADRTSEPAQIVGRDPDTDLAVLQIQPRAGVEPVRLGDSDAVRIGQVAVAIGSPLGLRQTVTQGIVSALRAPGEEAANGPIGLLSGAIQTDASINPGNSGGPLFDALGNVIGVNTAIITSSGGSEGLGLAIPSNVVKRIVPDLIQYGRYRHPDLGVRGIPVSALGQTARRQLGIPESITDGVLVLQVSDAARQAGVQTGTTPVTVGALRALAGADIVVAVDGQPVGTQGELQGYVDNTHRPGDTVTLTVARGEQRLDLPVQLGERPSATGATRLEQPRPA
jgi:S1-C subfamily serine protease